METHFKMKQAELNIPIDQMLAWTKHLIAEKKPTSIVRYGDGEAIVLSGWSDIEKLKRVLRRQLGYVPPVEEIEAIQANLIEAYKGADIIGVPADNRFMDDPTTYWHRAYSILEKNIGEDVLAQKVLTDIDFHSHWLETGAFDQLLTGRDNVCYISCRQLDSQLKKRFDINKVWSFIISPEMMFTSGYKGPKHFPDQYNQIRRWVTKVPVENNICLVGAGYVGKIYCNWFRDLGGIAIDIGSVFDSWSGRKTRGPGRGVDAVDDQFKI